MAVNGVSFDDAKVSQSKAVQYWNKATAEEKGELTRIYGSDFEKRMLSQDGTEYKIDDVSYDAAKEAGKEATAESVGYDGSKDQGTVNHLLVNPANGVGSAAALVVGNIVAKKVGEKAVNVLGKSVVKSAVGKTCGEIGTKTVGDKTVKTLGDESAKKLGKSVGAWVAATLAAAEATRYLAAKPNEEQVEAANALYENELPQGQMSLDEAQENMNDASEEIAEKGEEAEEKNEEANAQIEENKILFDFYRQQYEAVKAKKESGQELTEDEKALAKQLTPVMQQLGEGITTTMEDTSQEVSDLQSDIGEKQDVFDESGETIAEVEGITEYAEGFDESTRTMTYVESVNQGLNATSAGIAVGQLVATNVFGINLPFIALGTYAAAVSGTGMTKQLGYASQMTDEIHARRDVQEFNAETTEAYEEHLDNFDDTQAVIEDLELEEPEDMAVPQDASSVTADNGANNANNNSANPFLGGVQQDSNNTNNNTNQTRGGNSAEDDKKPKDVK